MVEYSTVWVATCAGFSVGSIHTLDRRGVVMGVVIIVDTTTTTTTTTTKSPRLQEENQVL